MPIQITATRKLVWDAEQSAMVAKTGIAAHLVGNCGSVFATEGPLYVDNDAAQYKEAADKLRRRLTDRLTGEQN